jgi:hypothetical protein
VRPTSPHTLKVAGVKTPGDESPGYKATLGERAQKPGVFAWAKSKGVFRQDSQDYQD